VRFFLVISLIAHVLHAAGGAGPWVVPWLLLGGSGNLLVAVGGIMLALFPEKHEGLVGILRLGKIELRLETDAAGASAASKGHFDRTAVIPGGVKLTELELGARGGGFDTKGSGFSRKTNKVNQIFIIIGVVLGLVILGLLIYIASTIKR